MNEMWSVSRFVETAVERSFRTNTGKIERGFSGRQYVPTAINYPRTSSVIAISKVRRQGLQLWPAVRYC